VRDFGPRFRPFAVRHSAQPCRFPSAFAESCISSSWGSALAVAVAAACTTAGFAVGAPWRSRQHVAERGRSQPGFAGSPYRRRSGLISVSRRSFEPFGGVYPREWAQRQRPRRRGGKYWLWVPLFAFALAASWQVMRNWTDALIGLCVLSFIVQCYEPRWEHEGVLDSNTLYAPESSHRVITSAFLHASWFHLGANMLGLWQIGHLVERTFGPGRFLLVYLGSSVGAALTSLWGKARFGRGRDIPSVGASGGVLGVMAALLIYRWRHGLPFQELWLVLMLNLAVGAASPMVDNLGHVGGAASGAAAAYLWGPRYVFLFGGVLMKDAPIIIWPFV